MALNGPEQVASRCLLTGVDRTCRTGLPRSEFDPTETWRAPCLWHPFPASLAGGAGARPDHPITRRGPSYEQRHPRRQRTGKRKRPPIETASQFSRNVRALLRDALDGEGMELRIFFADLPSFLERR